ncbi:MAG TPA: intradiol ring-cleavage dioxygenase [Acidimicrobiia bacterium]|nr:intradiol ring-cleavage dioxygenase [Acidimicrobiia bacterium]
MRNINESTVTEAAVGLIKAEDPRLTVVMESLIRHLHAFIRDVELTEEEWMVGIRFLTATGQISDDKRQEFILLSDTLGASILVDAINHRKSAASTESTVFGPFWVSGSPHLENGARIARGPQAAAGETTVVHGVVKGENGLPLAGAVIDVWQASPAGLYDVQDPAQPEMNLRGLFHTDAEGRFWFVTVKPAAYPIPDDGPVGDMLRATGRHPMRPAHIHFMIDAAAHERLITHIFVEGDPYLESDAVLGVKDGLVTEFIVNECPEDAERWGVVSPFTEVRFDFTMEPVG